MNILIIEDNIHKRKKIISYLVSKNNNIKFDEASSYSSGIELAEKNQYDCLILDMSMPTYDITDIEGGGQFRVFGGKDILKRLQRKNKLIAFVVVTQYSTFSETKSTKTFDEIETELSKKFFPYFRKAIFYDTASSAWKEELYEAVMKND